MASPSNNRRREAAAAAPLAPGGPPHHVMDQMYLEPHPDDPREAVEVPPFRQACLDVQNRWFENMMRRVREGGGGFRVEDDGDRDGQAALDRGNVRAAAGFGFVDPDGGRRRGSDVAVMMVGNVPRARVAYQVEGNQIGVDMRFPVPIPNFFRDGIGDIPVNRVQQVLSELPIPNYLRGGEIGVVLNNVEHGQPVDILQGPRMSNGLRMQHANPPVDAEYMARSAAAAAAAGQPQFMRYNAALDDFVAGDDDADDPVALQEEERVRRELNAMLMEAERDLPNAMKEVEEFVTKLPRETVHQKITLVMVVVEILNRYPDWLPLDLVTTTLIPDADTAEAFWDQWMETGNPTIDQRLEGAVSSINRFGWHGGDFFDLVPNFPQWPSDETRSRIEMLVINIKHPETKFRILEGIIRERLPQCANSVAAAQYGRRLKSIIEKAQFSHPTTVNAWLTWLSTIPHCLVTPSSGPMNVEIPRVNKMHNYRVNQHTRRTCIATHAAAASPAADKIASLVSIQDEAAPADASMGATCILCSVNYPRVCFIPCGHILACGACTRKLYNSAGYGARPKCPACRKVVNDVVPCILPEAYRAEEPEAKEEEDKPMAAAAAAEP